MSNVDVYRMGYQIDEDNVVKIPDWKPIERQEVEPVTEDNNEFVEFHAKNEEENSESESVAAEKDCAIEPRREEKPQPPEPAVKPLTLEQVEKINQETLMQLKREVTQRAYNDARSSKQQELEKCIRHAKESLEELQQMHADYVARYTESLKYMAIEIANKIMMTHIEEDDSCLETLVLQTMGSIKHAEWISVDLSDKLTGLITRMEQELEHSENEANVKVNAGSFPMDTVRIHTENGTIDASISTQIENLRSAFEKAEIE